MKKYGVMMALVSLSFLTSCQAVSEKKNDVIRTATDTMTVASGALKEGKNKLNAAIETVAETAKDVKNRVETLQKGVEQVQAGSDSIKKALKP